LNSAADRMLRNAVLAAIPAAGERGWPDIIGEVKAKHPSVSASDIIFASQDLEEAGTIGHRGGVQVIGGYWFRTGKRPPPPASPPAAPPPPAVVGPVAPGTPAPMGSPGDAPIRSEGPQAPPPAAPRAAPPPAAPAPWNPWARKPDAPPPPPVKPAPWAREQQSLKLPGF
jgi:hypothetical protein